MNRQTAQMLNKMNAAFYARVAQSFSDTRQTRWPGWEQLVRVLGEQGLVDALGTAGGAAGLTPEQGEAPSTHLEALHVCDIACGNLRFEHFLLDALPQTTFDFTALDNCAALPHCGFFTSIASCLRARIHFTQTDLVSALLNQHELPCARNTAQLCTAFGFMHHVPGFDARTQLLREMCRITAGGGVFAVSLWRFMDEPHLAQKAHASQSAALPVLHEALGENEVSLDENDYLLGWQDATGVFRYCHHFADEEITRLTEWATAQLPVSLVARYDADGRTGALNTYLVFRKAQ